jgi:hypothetical protein
MNPPVDTMILTFRIRERRAAMIPFSLDHARNILGRTPSVLESLLRDLPADWSGRSHDGESWSPFDVLGHLIHGERTDWIPRMRSILDHGTDRTFVPFDRDAMFENSRGKSLADVLNEFRLLRNENLRILDTFALTGAHLRLKGIHPAFGVVTLQQLIAAWVVHDLGHLTQIARSMARQYTDEVGPWIAYLGVLGKK